MLTKAILICVSDLPVIVSGRHCVYLDPQEHIWKDRFNAFSPGKKFDLTKLYRETDVLDSFNEICGFKSCRKYFPATLIRLPLRKCASDNSDPQTVPQGGSKAGSIMLEIFGSLTDFTDKVRIPVPYSVLK